MLGQVFERFVQKSPISVAPGHHLECIRFPPLIRAEKLTDF
jgi:hypothetical protein